MDVKQHLEEIFAPLTEPTPLELKSAVEQVKLTRDDLAPYLDRAGVFPYGRKLLFKSPHVEVLVMNWAIQRECAPHDHGSSFGWIRVIEGELIQTLYSLDHKGVPHPWLRKGEDKGALFFAPRGGIHQMGNFTDKEMVTLHIYGPPIQGMKVYDLNKCAACIVSDDCGAWWPTEQRQLVKELKLALAMANAPSQTTA